MKKIHIYTMALAGVLTMASCADDFLDQKNTTSLSPEGFFDSDEAAKAATSALYNYVWNDFNSKFYYGMGDGRANNITAQYSDYIFPYTNFAETALSEGLADAWNSLYSVVAQSDNAIYNIETYSTSGVSETVKKQTIGEARFMRGLAYWYIGSLWGGGIIYENTGDLVNSYGTVMPCPRTDLIEFAIRDLEYAAAYLPETPETAGRLTKYSAFAALSRVYLSMAGLVSGNDAYDGSNIVTNFDRGTRNTYYLDLAKKAALKVITESSAQLLSDYGDLFSNDLGVSNNNAESLFQLQWLTGSTDAIGWGCNQSISSFFAWSAMVSDGGINWGGATYCSWDLWKEFNKEKTRNGQPDLRRHWCVASIGEEYPELGTDDNGVPYTYGVTESAGNQGANIRKYVVGLNKWNGYSYKQSGGINTTMIRLAEVYLNYAEAVLGNEESTSDAQALQYFNAVRSRAGLTNKSSISYEDIRHEYRLEFAFEGLYWYYLLRRSYYRQTEVLAYVNNQQRNASYGTSSDYTEEETEGYKLSKDYVAPGSQVSIAKEANLVLPVPDTDQGKNPNLKPIDEFRNMNTVPYEFGEREVSVSELFN